MAKQEGSSTSETAAALNKKTLWQSTIASLRILFVFSKALPFIGGLVVSYKYVEIAVVSTLMDYLSDSNGINDDRTAAVLTNLQDGLSSIFFVFISLMSEAYTGTFTAITICTAASIQGLMLLWTSASSSFWVFYAAIFLLAIGNSGQNLVESLYENKLQEKIKEKRQQGVGGAIDRNIWLLAPSIVGYIITLILAFIVNIDFYLDYFRFGALLIGGTYLFFLFGSVWYKPKELNVNESNIHKIYRICRAAFGKRKLKYPTSLDCYYWKDYKQGHVYELNEGQRLLPRVPRLFRWLDKAAIVVNEEKESSDVEASLMTEEKNGKLCYVKEVREVKSLVPMMYLGLFIFPYSLLMATGNTFFVAQASNITDDTKDISILFVIKDGMIYVSRFIYFIISSFAFRRMRIFKAINYRSKRKAGTIIRICFGMVCALTCSLIAWKVEHIRLSSPSNITSIALVPQFIMLGMTEGLVDEGLSSLFRDNVAESMWSFEYSYKELVIGSGKFLIIPLVLIIRSWFKESVSTSHLNRFYLMLAILNAVFFPFFAYYCTIYAYKEDCPQDEQVTMDDHQHPADSGDHSNQENSEANPGNQEIEDPQISISENTEIEDQQISDPDNELESTDFNSDNNDNISPV